MVCSTKTTRHILITGAPGCGKTTLLMRLVSHFADQHPAGFYTEEIREGGVRQGFRMVSLDGREGVLSHARFKGRQRVGRYGVDVLGFEEFLAGLGLVRADTPLVFIDEIGKMECLSPQFVAQMRELLDSGKFVVATIALKGTGFIAEVKKEQIAVWLKSGPVRGMTSFCSAQKASVLFLGIGRFSKIDQVVKMQMGQRGGVAFLSCKKNVTLKALANIIFPAPNRPVGLLAKWTLWNKRSGRYGLWRKIPYNQFRSRRYSR